MNFMNQINQHMKTKILTIGVLVSATMISCSGEREGGFAVVDLQELYNSFNYQLELKDEFEKMQFGFTAQRDSLDQAIQFIESDLATNNTISGEDKNVIYERAYVNYLDKKEWLQYQEDSIAGNYTARVWTHLNSYLGEYGDEKDFDVIIGMQGDGTVMYVKDQVDVTEDVIAYVNEKYEGS